MGLLYLAWRHLVHQRRAALLLVGCLALVIGLPSATRLLTADFERELGARAAATPLVAGAEGNRFDLVLLALYFRAGALEPIPHGALAELSEGPADLVVPLSVRFTARDRPIVATTPEYFEVRGLRAASGRLPTWLGECALGAAVARELELSAGDELYSDAREQYDLAQAPPAALKVAGVLAETGGPDDGAVFATLETAWLLEGLLHGHGEATELDPALLLGRGDDRVVVGPALIEHRSVEPERLADFHLHADRGALPISAALVFPANRKSNTMIRTRVNAGSRARASAAERVQVVVPTVVVEELLAYVFRIRALLDLFALVLGGATLALGVLVVLLSLRLRSAELATLEKIGAGSGGVAALVGAEVLTVALAALCIVGAGLGLLRAFVPDLTRFL